MLRALHSVNLWPYFLCIQLISNGSPCFAEAANSLAATEYEIPFEYTNGFIIVAVNIDGVLPTKFIFDTGSQHTILASPELISLLGREPDDLIRIVGSDLSTALTGYIIRRTSIRVGPLQLGSQPLILLDADVLDLAELTGDSVYGILGIRAFGAYAMTIDYRRLRIRLQTRVPREQRRDGVRIPLTLKDRKPYLMLPVRVHAGFADTLELLMDTGASLELLLHADSRDSLLYPPKIVLGSVGFGLGGELFGYVGRSDSIRLGSLHLRDVITHFQPTNDAEFVADIPLRSGLLGNRLLDRFLVTLDFPNEVLYLKPTRKYARRRPYDRSGLTLVAAGATLREVLVQLVTPGSPAADVGFRSGDQITHVNGVPTRLMGLNRTQARLRKKVGKLVKLRLIRNGVSVSLSFRLEDLI